MSPNESCNQSCWPYPRLGRWWRPPSQSNLRTDLMHGQPRWRTPQRKSHMDCREVLSVAKDSEVQSGMPEPRVTQAGPRPCGALEPHQWSRSLFQAHWEALNSLRQIQFPNWQRRFPPPISTGFHYEEVQKMDFKPCFFIDAASYVKQPAPSPQSSQVKPSQGVEAGPFGRGLHFVCSLWLQHICYSGHKYDAGTIITLVYN